VDSRVMNCSNSTTTSVPVVYMTRLDKQTHARYDLVLREQVERAAHVPALLHMLSSMFDSHSQTTSAYARCTYQTRWRTHFFQSEIIKFFKWLSWIHGPHPIWPHGVSTAAALVLGHRRWRICRPCRAE
jgi:hypothetical protein